MKKNLVLHTKLTLKCLLLRKVLKEQVYVEISLSDVVFRSKYIDGTKLSSELDEEPIDFYFPIPVSTTTEITFRLCLKSSLMKRCYFSGKLLPCQLKSSKQKISFFGLNKEPEASVEVLIAAVAKEMETIPNVPSISTEEVLEEQKKLLLNLENRFKSDLTKDFSSKQPKRYLMRYMEKFIISLVTNDYQKFFYKEIISNPFENIFYNYLTPSIADGKLYIFGDDQMQNFYEFNFALEKFKKIEKPFNIYLFGYSMAVPLPNGKIIITGGINKMLNIIVSTTYWYDPFKNRIEPLADMKQARYTHTACYHDGYLYVLGGRYYGKDKEGVLSHVERYCVASNKWESLKPMKERRCTAAALVYNENLYIFGGYHGSGRLNSIEKYSIAADDWTIIQMTMPQSIEAGCAFTLSNEGKIVYIAGKEDKINSTDCVVFDLSKGSYEKQQKLNSGRVLPRSAKHKNMIYIFGGAGTTWEKAELNKWNWTNMGSYIDVVNNEMKLFSSACKTELTEMTISENLLERVFFFKNNDMGKLEGLIFDGDKVTSLTKFINKKIFNTFQAKSCSCAPGPLGYILVVGGKDKLGNILKHSYLINPNELESTLKNKNSKDGNAFIIPTQSMNNERAFSILCSCKCFNYVFGGVNRNNEVWSTAERFNFDSNEWDYISPMPIGLFNGYAIESDNSIYIFGGKTSENKDNNKVLMYNILNNKWTVIQTQLPENLMGKKLCLILSSNFIYIFTESNKLVYNFDTSSSEFNIFYEDFPEFSFISQMHRVQSSDIIKVYGISEGNLVFTNIELKPSGINVLNAKAIQIDSSININEYIASSFTEYFKTSFCDEVNFTNVQLVNKNRKGYIFAKDKQNKSKILSFSFYSETFSVIETPSNFEYFNSGSSCGLQDGKILLTGGYRIESKSIIVENRCFIYNPFDNTYGETSSMKEPRMNHSTILFNGAIIVIGGQSKSLHSSTALATTEIFKNMQWTQGASLNIPRYDFGVALLSNSIYVFGGKNNSGPLKSIERYDPESGNWTLCADPLGYEISKVRAITLAYNEVLLIGNDEKCDKQDILLLELKNPTKFSLKKAYKSLNNYYKPCFFMIGNKIFVIGGNQSQRSEKIFLDLNGINENEQCEISSYENYINSDLSESSFGISEVDFSQTSYAVSQKNYRYLYIFGTENNQLIEKLDLETMTWSEVPKPENMKIWDYSIAVTLPSGKIFICGGINTQLNNIKKCAFLLTPKDDKMLCEELLDMNQDRYTHTCCYLNNYVYVMGGRNFGHGLQGVLQHCERFNLLTKKWEVIAPLKAKRCTATSFSFKNTIYIIGGFRGDGRVKSIEKYVDTINEWFNIPLLLHYPIEAETLIHLSDREIVLLGGKDDFAEQQYITIYNFERNMQIVPKNDKHMTSTRVLAKSARYHDKVCVIGGNANFTSEIASIWDFKWSKMSNTPKMISNNFTRTAFAQSY